MPVVLAYTYYKQSEQTPQQEEQEVISNLS